MSISEQVKELREVAEMYEGLDGGKILSEAADTIEALSAKLADMERSAEDCWKPDFEVEAVEITEVYETCDSAT